MNKPNEQTTLEKRAVAALGHDGLTALSAAELIAELTGALAAARQEAAAEEERALDPQQSPDLKAARERRDDAQLKVGRLETLQSQMQRRLSVVRELEWVRNYCEKRDVLQAEADGIEQELYDTYVEAGSRICDVCCSHFTADATLTSKRSAASRRDAPVSTAVITRSRRSRE